MTQEKKKFILSVTCLTIGILSNTLIDWLFPNLLRSSPSLTVVFLIIIGIPMMISMAYLVKTLQRFLLQRIVNNSERQKAQHFTHHQRMLRLGLTWLALACGFGLLVGSFNLPTYLALSKRGVSTQGRVFKTEKNAVVHYKFRVGSNSYEHLDLAPSPQSLTIGAKVPVLYDSQNPQTSILGPVKPRLTNELLFVGMVVLLFPVLIIVMFQRILLPNWKHTLTGKR